MTSFKRFECKPVVKIILIYDRLNLRRHRQFITIFYQFLHIRIEIIHGSHMYILFLLRVGIYVSFLLLKLLEHKDPDVFWLRVRLFVEVEFVVFSLTFELMFMNDNI
jgi:hypothetical protein